MLDRLGELRGQGDCRHHTAYDLAAAMTGSTPPASTVKSVRQAIRRLEAAGRVETIGVHGAARDRPPRQIIERRTGLTLYYPPPDRRMLAVRLPLTEDEAAEEATARAASEERAQQFLSRFVSAVLPQAKRAG